MNARGTAPAKSGTMGVQSAMPAEQRCGVDSCEERRVAAFRNENLCCDHFLGRCYEFLEGIDPNRDFASNGGQKPEETKKLIEECAQRTLEVALGNRNLSNVQRARLLDILLWTSDVTIARQIREADKGNSPRTRKTSSIASAENEEKKWERQGTSLRTSLLW
jgi:hypothetical protein